MGSSGTSKWKAIGHQGYCLQNATFSCVCTRLQWIHPLPLVRLFPHAMAPWQRWLLYRPQVQITIRDWLVPLRINLDSLERKSDGLRWGLVSTSVPITRAKEQSSVVQTWLLGPTNLICSSAPEWGAMCKVETPRWTYYNLLLTSFLQQLRLRPACDLRNPGF